MRKWILGLLAVLLLLLAGAYAFIPSKVEITEVAGVNASPFSAYRCLTSAEVVRQWWKENHTTVQQAGQMGVRVSQGDDVFILKPQMYNIVAVDIGADKDAVKSYLMIMGLTKDSALVQWKTEWPATSNIFARVQQYLQGRQLKKQMAAALDQFSSFMKNEDQVYGLKIQNTMVTDTLLVTTKMSTSAYPSTAAYYELIQKLQQHVERQGAQQTNYPMLNILAIDSNQYETMVAIPINKIIPEGDGIDVKRMVPGKILTAEVNGGRYAIEKGFLQMEHYISENSLTPPAIPFQSLVTNRLAEGDTSKWITRLYYPVL